MLAPLLFNNYNVDVLTTVSSKLIYADDIDFHDRDIKLYKVTHMNDLNAFKKYFRTQKLKTNLDKSEYRILLPSQQ